MNANENRELLQNLIECAMACEACASACLNEEDVGMMARCIELDRDCADTCFYTSKLVLRNSEISDSALGLCEEMCRLCAEECRKHEHDHCRECAEACERCAEACHAKRGDLHVSR